MDDSGKQRQMMKSSVDIGAVFKARVLFNFLSGAFFVLTVLFVVFSNNQDVFGRGGVLFLCAFSCALIGNLENFESVKASVSGIEAKTREAKEIVEEARVALSEFQKLSELSGGMILELMASGGRIGGIPYETLEKRRSLVMQTLAKVGLSEDALNNVKSFETYYVKIDYCLGIFRGIEKSNICSREEKTRAQKMLEKWREEEFRPDIADIRAIFDDGVCKDHFISDLILDLEYYEKYKEQRRLDVWLKRSKWMQI